MKRQNKQGAGLDILMVKVWHVIIKLLCYPQENELHISVAMLYNLCMYKYCFSEVEVAYSFPDKHPSGSYYQFSTYLECL